ncbi:MAG: ABC transporter ATP-binding protein [Gemmataceae bacterium]|nr:ABC transporter ATP-binding protein [Gemmataceae bacterium]
MHPAIRVTNVSKRFRLGSGGGSALNLTERLLSVVRRRPETRSEFWALRDISFAVQPGETIGIIGRNGAGKSTLLKVLARIVEPSEGRVELRGRVGSLLEVGTGFHPELTGRENIYLNGSVLGMTRREIRRKFDDIVAFAGLEPFLDTPVKRYSSGMYVRLAFAVAAHLEPEILIVDEVLAVGDGDFQKRCLGKMREISLGGRTVLFVSHNMAAVRAFCSRALFLANGRVMVDGTVEHAIRAYTTSGAEATVARDLRSHPGRVSRHGALMSEVRLTDALGTPVSVVPAGGTLAVRVKFAVPTGPIRPVLGVVVRDHYGTALFGLNNRWVPNAWFEPICAGWISCTYPCLPLQPGTYSLDLWLANENEDIDIVMDAIRFDVIAGDFFGSGKLPHPSCGPVLVPATFHCQADQPGDAA